MIYKFKNFRTQYIKINQKLLKKAGYLSQYGQDKYVSEYFKFLKYGVFVDIGANEGKNLE